MLTNLSAHSVRGIPRSWPELPIGRRGLIAYGANGVGKSSIVDAIEFALCSRSTLYAANRQNVNWEAGSPHVRDGNPNIALQVTVDSQTFSVSPVGQSAEIGNKQQEWLGAARKASFVLRRHMLLRFISEEPRHRYSLLEPFMNLESYRAVENELRDWTDTLETQRVSHATTVSRLEITLRSTFGLPDGALEQFLILGKLNDVLLHAELSPCDDFSKLELSQSAVARQLGSKEETEKLGQLVSLRQQAQQLGLATDLSQFVDLLVSAVQDLEHQVATRTEQVFTDLLVRGIQTIEAGSLDVCPLCEQAINRGSVLARLRERVRADERISTARNLVSQRKGALVQHARQLSESFARFIAGSESGSRPVSLPAEYHATKSILDDLVSLLESPTINLALLRELRAQINSTITTHQPIIAQLSGRIEGEGGGERRRLLNVAASMIEVLFAEWPRFQAARSELERVNGTQQIMRRLYGHSIEARKSAVGEILDGVASTANRYYDAIHPGEQIGTSSLAVRDIGQGSVTLTALFHGSQENPLLHYSESHLDTLGLCYFLALRKLEALVAPSFKLLVLDDVMHSVDAAHRSRVAELLRREFGDHQMIITTHDFHFFEALRRMMGIAGFTYVRINNWDFVRGPVLGDPSTDLNRIVDPSIRAGLGHEVLSGAAGRFFEWILRESTERLRVAVPARFSREHDIGNLWPPLAAKLRRQRGFTGIHATLADELDRSSWVRNACGAHYNAPASPVTPSEVQEFGALLADLYQALACGDCGGLVIRQDNDDWRCECGNLAYPR